jgi:hypothetical protein
MRFSDLRIYQKLPPHHRTNVEYFFLRTTLESKFKFQIHFQGDLPANSNTRKISGEVNSKSEKSKSCKIGVDILKYSGATPKGIIIDDTEEIRLLLAFLD